MKQLQIRSKLFVPGSRPEIFQKAALGPADSISFDLEDAVAADSKNEARRYVREYLAGEGAGHGKVNIVRVNSVGSDLFLHDMENVIVPSLDVLNLPKVQGRDDVMVAVRALEHWEQKAGIAEPIGLLATIESPRGVRLAYEIAAAHPRVVGLQIGMVDMNLACGFETGNRAALNGVRLELRLAASEAGIAVFDGAFPRVADVEGYRREAEEARSLGLNGKSCIHPSQVPVANEIFSPTKEEVARALKLLEAAKDSSMQGAGAFLHDGDMVDAPVLQRARDLVARAHGGTQKTEGDGN